MYIKRTGQANVPATARLMMIMNMLGDIPQNVLETNTQYQEFKILLRIFLLIKLEEMLFPNYIIHVTAKKISNNPAEEEILVRYIRTLH